MCRSNNTLLYQFKAIRWHTAFREMCILFGMLCAFFSPLFIQRVAIHPDSIHLNGRFVIVWLHVSSMGFYPLLGEGLGRMIFIGKCQPLKSLKWSSSRKHTGAWFLGNFTWSVYSRYLRNSHTYTHMHSSLSPSLHGEAQGLPFWVHQSFRTPSS